MKLYIVDFKYYDTYEKQEVYDRWFLACKDDSEVEKAMELNIEEFKRCGYDLNHYSFKKLDTTDNGYKISIEVE